MNYNDFHKEPKVQLKTISKNNFTYRNTLDLLERIPLFHNMKVLDYGCGVGTVDFYLAKNKGVNVIGLEVSNKALNVCRKSAMAMNIQNKCHFFSYDKKINDKFDLIICSEVIEHVENDYELLHNLVRMLNRNGYIFISTPSISAPLYKLGMLKDFDNRVGHLRRYSDKNFLNIIKKLKLKTIKFEKKEGILRNSMFTFSNLGWIVKFLKGPISDLITAIDDCLAKLLGESNLIILAQKI